MSESIDESAFGMSTLKLMWSEDALREAYDASEVSMVSLATKARQGGDGLSGAGCTPAFVLVLRFCIEQHSRRLYPCMARGPCLNL